MIQALLIAATLAAAPPPDLAAVIATERAFATKAGEAGIPAAFRDYAAPDGLVFRDRPVNARAAYAGDAKGSTLVWRPHAAGIARSGDLAFDTGPFTLTGAQGVTHGWFFTVWGKQPDGSWRFLADNGVVSGSGPSPIPDAEPQPMAQGKSSDAKTAFRDAQKAEVLMSMLGYGIGNWLVDDSWVLRSGSQAATGKAAAALAKFDPRIAYTPLGGKAAAAGDLAYTYGRAAWSNGRGHYLRVWQKRGGGWKIVIDSLVPVPPAKN